jgi:hypothetical protein
MPRLILLSILAILLAPFACAAEFGVAGTVSHIQGTAVAKRGTTSSALSKDARLLVGDRIVTGHNARILLRMIDGAELTLGADTEFAIRDYHYSETAQQGSAALELVKGVFRAVTGAIGKLKERDFKVKTAVGTIGIRGTDFWGGYYFSQALDVALLGGAGIYVENAAGRIEVTAIGDGTTINSANEPPSAPLHWGTQKLDAAKQSVSLD